MTGTTDRLERQEDGERADERREGGYSLLEILVVLAIIGTLLALVGPNLIGNVDKSRVVAAKAQTKTLRLALDNFNLDMGRYPTTTEGLDVLMNPPDTDSGRWFGPYLDEDLPQDPWGNPFIYQPATVSENGRRSIPRVVSLGADGAEGGNGIDADIAS